MQCETSRDQWRQHLWSVYMNQAHCVCCSNPYSNSIPPHFIDEETRAPFEDHALQNSDTGPEQAQYCHVGRETVSHLQSPVTIHEGLLIVPKLYIGLKWHKYLISDTTLFQGVVSWYRKNSWHQQVKKELWIWGYGDSGEPYSQVGATAWRNQYGSQCGGSPEMTQL